MKAYEAEAKRAERNAKAYRGDSLEQYWLTYACKVRQYKQLAEQVTAQWATGYAGATTAETTDTKDI